MKKAVVLLLSCILVLGIIAGCSGGSNNANEGSDTGNNTSNKTGNSSNEEQSKQNESQLEKKVNLQFSIWGNDAHKEMYEGLAGKFNETHPNISVEVMTIPFNEYQQKLSIMLASNSAPDVVWMAERMIPQFLGADQLLPISQLQDEGDYQFDDIIPSTLDLFTKNDEIYGVPFSTPPIMIYYNKNLFAEHGLKTPLELYQAGNWTYDEYLKAARTIADKDNGTYGVSFIHNGWSNWHDNLTPILWSHGAQLLNKEGTRFTLNSPEAEGALQTYHDLMFKEGVHPKPGDQTTFDTGKIGMLQELFSYMGKAREIKDFEWDIAPMPEGPSGRGTWMGFAGYTIPKTTKHPEEAYEFLKFITNAESYAVTSQFFVPARKSVLESDEYLKNGPSPESVQLTVIDQMGDARIKDVHENWQKIDTKMQTTLDHLHTGTVPVKEVLEMMEKEISPLLQ